MSADDKRNSQRHRVHLAVRYATASKFVQEYAENLSRGGLFIPDAHHLEPLSEVQVELDLPGAGTFAIKGVVAHILTPELAERMQRSPGAGIEIKRVPKGFKDALGDYLSRLGRRADATVLAVDPACGAALREAGYKVQPAPVPKDLAGALAGVLAVVAPGARAAAYRRVAPVVVEMDSPAQIDAALTRLDEEL